MARARATEAPRSALPSAKRGDGRRGGKGQRKLFALRIPAAEERLQELLRPYIAEETDADLAYRIWQRGLKVALAEYAGLGMELPREESEELVAARVAQLFLLCLPLLRRTGKLELLGLEAAGPVERPAWQVAAEDPEIDASSPDAITGLGGSEFL